MKVNVEIEELDQGFLIKADDKFYAKESLDSLLLFIQRHFNPLPEVVKVPEYEIAPSENYPLPEDEVEQSPTLESPEYEEKEEKKHRPKRSGKGRVKEECPKCGRSSFHLNTKGGCIYSDCSFKKEGIE